jgi:hypothetical protein
VGYFSFLEETPESSPLSPKRRAFQFGEKNFVNKIATTSKSNLLIVSDMLFVVSKKKFEEKLPTKYIE